VTRKRIALIAASSLAALLLLGAVVGVLTLRSPWFKEKVRRAMIAAVEDATGGRAEIRDYRFDWRRLRIEVDGLVLHGTEPAGRPPLFAATSVAVGLRIVSLWRRDINIRYLDVKEPHVYLIVYPDGRTNVPEPRVKRRPGRRDPMDDDAVFLPAGGLSLLPGGSDVHEMPSAP